MHKIRTEEAINAFEKAPEYDGEDIAPPKTEDREREEYAERQANGECTCDLLSPFGHVTCAYCNNWGPSDDDEDFATLADELGI